MRDGIRAFVLNFLAIYLLGHATMSSRASLSQAVS